VIWTPSRSRSIYWSALFASVLSLAGCATQAGHPGGAGNLFDAQASMTAPNTNRYLPVHDMPPERTEPLMSPAEVAKVRGELSAARGLTERRVKERP
jgi:hypothetical protein